jgi:hypothetical protein
MPEVMIKPAVFGRFIIVSADNPNLAWTGSQFAAAKNGIALDVQICNFATREEAKGYLLQFLDLDLVPGDFVRKHVYLSTACHHEEHDRCRKQCKFCQSKCNCRCHLTIDNKPTAGGE